METAQLWQPYVRQFLTMLLLNKLNVRIMQWNAIAQGWRHLLKTTHSIDEEVVWPNEPFKDWQWGLALLSEWTAKITMCNSFCLIQWTVHFSHSPSTFVWLCSFVFILFIKEIHGVLYIHVATQIQNRVRLKHTVVIRLFDTLSTAKGLLAEQTWPSEGPASGGRFLNVYTNKTH